MSSLLDTQRLMAKLVMQPMTTREGMRKSNRALAEKISKPNDRLTGFERLEIYSRSYWFRVLDCLAEDFAGVRTILGVKRFRRLSEAYLGECPSSSFTLRNLGSQLERWLRKHPQWMGGRDQLVLDMVALEWAHIEAFDGLQRPALTAEELAHAGAELTLQLQPFISLLSLHYPVDDLSIAVREEKPTRRIVTALLGSHPQNADIYLAVHRVDNSVCYKRLEREAFQLLSAIKGGADLMSAIEEAFQPSGWTEEQQAKSVEEWFRLWQSLSWFCAGRPDLSGPAMDPHGQTN